MQETSKHHHKERLKFPYIIRSFEELLTSRRFMCICLCVFFTYGGFFSWFTAGPVLLIDHAGVSPVEFGLITLFGGGAIATSGFINGRVVDRFGPKNMLRFGWLLMLIAGIAMFVGRTLFGVNVVAIVAPVVIFYFGATFIWPNAFAIAFESVEKTAGYASSLYSSMQIGGGGVVGLLEPHLPDQNQMP